MRVILRGDAVRLEAARRNQSIAEVAASVGLDPRHLSRMMAGQMSPSPLTRRKICQRLGLPFEELFEIVTLDAPEVGSI